MNLDGHGWKKEIRKLVLGIGVGIFIYATSYFLNSFFGGFWLVPEMDGHDRYSFGLAMPTAFIWQPLFGHEAIGNYDSLGVFYEPAIRLDRRFIHLTIYLSDKHGFEKVANLPASTVHPHWRDDFLTKVTATAIIDETNKLLRCVFRYSGSDNPREIIEIKMRREVADSLGATSSPNGFVQKPYEDSYQFLDTNYVHWVGKLPLVKDQDVILQFPATQPKAGTGNIVFFYQRTDNAIDSKGLCSVELK
jgi:hypothetical protein